MTRPMILMLPGMMCDHRLFASQVERFGAEYEVVVGDLRGRSSIEELASDLVEGLHGRKCCVAGLSMGGIVALEIARQAEGQVAGLVLLNTNYRADADWRRPVRERQIATARRGGALEVVRDEMMPSYFSPKTIDVGRLEDLTIDMAKQVGCDAFVSQSLALMHRRDYQHVLQTMEVPVLAVVGSDDVICPPALHRELVALCRSGRCVEIPGCGHLSTVERPEAVNEALASFFKEKKWH